MSHGSVRSLVMVRNQFAGATGLIAEIHVRFSNFKRKKDILWILIDRIVTGSVDFHAWEISAKQIKINMYK